MHSFTPRSSVAAIATGTILFWLLGPGIGAFGYLISTTPSPDAGRVALPIMILAGGVSVTGLLCTLAGIFRALRTIDFLGWREAERMETEDRGHDYADS